MISMVDEYEIPDRHYCMIIEFSQFIYKLINLCTRILYLLLVLIKMLGKFVTMYDNTDLHRWDIYHIYLEIWVKKKHIDGKWNDRFELFNSSAVDMDLARTHDYQNSTVQISEDPPQVAT